VLLSRALPAFLLLSSLLVAAGCKTGGVTAETYCYQVTGAVVHTVDTGMTVAGDLYRTGRLTEAQKGRLVAAHDIYRPAAQAAVAGCKAVGSQQDADKMVKQIKKAADKILESLVAAGVL
jgi:hypothetical protein